MGVSIRGEVLFFAPCHALVVPVLTSVVLCAPCRATKLASCLGELECLAVSPRFRDAHHVCVRRNATGLWRTSRTSVL